MQGHEAARAGSRARLLGRACGTGPRPREERFGSAVDGRRRRATAQQGDILSWQKTRAEPTNHGCHHFGRLQTSSTNGLVELSRVRELGSLAINQPLSRDGTGRIQFEWERAMSRCLETALVAWRPWCAAVCETRRRRHARPVCCGGENPLCYSWSPRNLLPRVTSSPYRRPWPRTPAGARSRYPPSDPVPLRGPSCGRARRPPGPGAVRGRRRAERGIGGVAVRRVAVGHGGAGRWVRPSGCSRSGGVEVDSWSRRND